MQKENAPRKRKKKRSGGNGRVLRAVLVVMLCLGLAGLGAILALDSVSPQMMRSYPVEYVDLIRENARLQGLDPAYVAAVILAESSYNPSATSSVNAQGLMQIMPDTGEWIAGKFDEAYIDGSLYDPATNIKYGCWYLGFLMRRYDGNMACSSAAYHSGQGTVDEWLKNSEYSADGRTLDVIPGSNARTYVKRILEYYEKYEEIYAGEAA